MNPETANGEPTPAPPQPQPLPPQPGPYPGPPPRRSGGMVAGIIVLVVVIIVVLAAVLVVFNGNGDGDENNGDDKKLKGKYLTAKEGKTEADEVALEWNENAVLQKVRGYEGDPIFIFQDDWEWVEDYNVDTGNDEVIGDGKCVAWEYEYFPEDGDLFDRLLVIVASNGTVTSWEPDRASSANSGTLNSMWNYDSHEAVEIAKTKSYVVNITKNAGEFTYGFYEIRPGIWDISFSNKTAYTPIHIDDETGEITYAHLID
jgi:hypothetical protein